MRSPPWWCDGRRAGCTSPGCNRLPAGRGAAPRRRPRHRLPAARPRRTTPPRSALRNARPRNAPFANNTSSSSTDYTEDADKSKERGGRNLFCNLCPLCNLWIMRAVEIIRTKRDDGELSPAEIESFVRSATTGEGWADYQLSALLMAIFC